VDSARSGQGSGMDESTRVGSAAHSDDAEPQVSCTLDGDVALLTLKGELTEAARRPLVRVMTDLLLGHHDLRAVRLDLHEVRFMNSAGMSVLVQLQKLGQPRGVDVILHSPTEAVVRPLQLTGLWHRFPIEDYDGL
jgi:anti-anti-sigma factor